MSIICVAWNFSYLDDLFLEERQTEINNSNTTAA